MKKKNDNIRKDAFIEKACDAYCRLCDTKECGDTGECEWLEKQGEQKPKDRYTFKSIPRLLEMIKPTDKAKAYCQKLINTLAKEGYNIDAKIVEEVLKGWNGEDVPMAVMEDQKSAWSEEDMKEALRTEYEKGRADTIAEMGKEWSEEDKLNLKQAIYVCHQHGYTGVENWLKSIKQRIGG